MRIQLIIITATILYSKTRLHFWNSIYDPKSTLSNWENAVPVCNFTGVTCDNRHHPVSQSDLHRFGLVGKISPFISNLTGLRVLNLFENYFFGTIPPQLSSLRHVRTLILDGNNLTGPVPDSFAVLNNLTLFFVQRNYLTRPLPPSFFLQRHSIKNYRSLFKLLHRSNSRRNRRLSKFVVPQFIQQSIYRTTSCLLN
ncbi:Leucine-rich repeat-containing N-terminal [Theobroma cacao]|nr:Leucine-rich repeat-containing N-terminal [Theobroma cacao]